VKRAQIARAIAAKIKNVGSVLNTESQ